jgi:hypothetical protein
MRIALTQSVPIGVMKSAARTSVGVPAAAMATPPAMARARATRTRVLSFKINSDCYHSALFSALFKIDRVLMRLVHIASVVSKGELRHHVSDSLRFGAWDWPVFAILALGE